ncbi:MAG: hypothetical protein ACMZ63_03855 [Methylotenera sp.]|jgi:hypothetical protein
MTSPLEKRIKSSLENTAQQLDAKTRQRLNSIRSQALEQPQQNNWLSILQSNDWMPATGFILCSFIVALFLLQEWKDSSHTNTFEQTAMLELIENPEDLDMLSDPGFYLWIDELEAQDV